VCVLEGLKADFRNTDLCARAPTEDKSERERILERTYMKRSSFDVGSLSADIGEEKWTSTFVADSSLHNESSVVGMRSKLFVT